VSNPADNPIDLARLVGDQPLRADDPMLGSTLGALCAPLQPQRLALLDAAGDVLLEHTIRDDDEPQWCWETLGLLLAGAFETERRRAWVVRALDPTRSWLVGVRLPRIRGCGATLGLVTNVAPADAIAARGCVGQVAAAGRLAWRALQAMQQCDISDERARQLQSEHQTLLRARDELMVANLTDRDRAAREKRQLIAALEDQVAMRTRELRVATEEASAASRLKSEFLARMSHEIRTPMTAILGYTDVLLGAFAEDNQERRALEIIQRNGQHLLALINDILDLSKIEAGRMSVERVACEPLAIVTDVVTLMRVRATEKGLTLNVAFDGPVPETIQTDPTRLRQIITNLVGNAIKFTTEGEITIRVATRDTAKPSPQLELTVCDTGPGIPPDQCERIFEAFAQAEASTTRVHGGTGLGLTISRLLARELGGDLTVTGVVNAGSTFCARVATGPLEGVRMIQEPTAALRGRVQPRTAPDRLADDQLPGLSGRILLAEDGPDNQRLIAHVLRRAGAEVTVVENGAEAVDAALAARDEGRPFGVVLMDMGMPVLDGYAATGKLRAAGYELPVIALTAHAMAHDRSRCINAGCDEYATKPIDRRALLRLLASYLEKAPAGD
jgi:signal transduction histidine kinase/ActR/RegA family two-component response regulator